MTKLRLDVFFLSLVISFVATGQTIVFPILPKYLSRFGGGSFEFGLSTSVYALFGVIFAPFIGRFADKTGKKRILVAEIATFGLINLVIPIAPSFEWFLVLRSLEGLVGTSTAPIAIAIVSEITAEEERARSIAYVTAGMSFGIIIGPTIGGVLLDSVGVIYPYILSGLLGIVGAILTQLLLKEGISEKSYQQAVGGPLLSRLPKPLYAFMLILLMNFINSIVWMMIEPGFIYHFYDNLGLSATDFGIFVSAYGVFIFFGEVILGGLSDKFGRKPILVLGAILNMIFYLALAFSEEFVLLVIAAVIAGIAGGLLGPALNALISEVSEEAHRSFVLSIAVSASYLASIIGPFFGGWYLDQGYSLKSLIFISVGLVSITIVTPLFLNFSKNDSFEVSSVIDNEYYPRPIGK